MRADRLITILLLMQARERVTARDIAGELGVSIATARRDLEALSLAGVPVFAQPGRHGGWSLVGGARTDLTGLTSDESTALFLLLGPDSGMDETIRSALRKLLQALPGPFRNEAERAMRATLTDRALWDHRERNRPAWLSTIHKAIVQQRQLRLTYVNRAGQRSERMVHGLGTIEKDGIWYLVAGAEDGERTFRLDRVVRVELTPLPAELPPDFDLGAAWKHTVAEVERQRAATTARLRVAALHLPVLEDHFGAAMRAVVSEPDASGQIEVEVSAPAPFMLASQLAGWGRAIVVLEPESVRAELARIGHELIAANAEPGAMTDDRPAP